MDIPHEPLCKICKQNYPNNKWNQLCRIGKARMILRFILVWTISIAIGLSIGRLFQ